MAGRFLAFRCENEITDMKGVEDIKDNTINREGEAIGSYYGLKAIGIYRTQADLDRVNANGQKILQNNQEPQLGDIMYEDIDNNGNINDADRTIIGNPFPKCSILSIWDSLIKILMSIHSGKALQVYIVIIGMKLLFPTVETRLAVGWTDGLKVIRMEACLVWEELLIITILHFG